MLGATVFTVACSDKPGFAPSARRWRAYRDLTPELEAAPRYFAGVGYPRFLTPGFFARAVVPYWRGDGAAMRAGFAERSDLSAGATDAAVDLVHCNHFFCMPIAGRIARGRPVVLDTIDIQARQFDLINDASFVLPPRISFDAMFAQELAAMVPAAALLHLNVEEKAVFEKHLPQAPHHLLYPAVRAMPGVAGGDAILIVASNNTANVESLAWFLTEVLPKAAHVRVKIAGNVDTGLKAREPDLYEKHRAMFLGRVDDLAALYRNARLVLLPTISGTGLSIKAVEALSTGLPLLASPMAFRGMTLDPVGLGNVTVAATAAEFAAALASAASESRRPAQADIAESDTRRAYERLFSGAAYARHLADIVLPLVPR